MKTCFICSKPIVRSRKESNPSFAKRKYCSLKCFWTVQKPKGAEHPSWKGGRYSHDGYVRLHIGDSQVFEHRLIMERVLGRPMLVSETVHHRNGIKNDNRPENLELRTGNHGKGASQHCPTCVCEKTRFS